MSPSARLQVFALVLAAGGAARFGSPKQLATLAGRSLLQRAVEQAQSVCPEQVIVVLGANAQALEPHAAPATVVHNSNWQRGMASSLGTGIAAVPATADAVLVMLCDQPAVASSQYQALLDSWRRQPHCAVAARYANIVGVPAIFPRRLFKRLRTLQGDSGARSVLQADAGAVVPVDMPQAALDVDLPDDLRQLQADLDSG